MEVYKKTGLLSQRMTQKPGEFSDSVLLEDYGDIPTPPSTEAVLENFPSYKEQFDNCSVTKPSSCEQ
jgi:hypothetical protein